MNKTLKIICYTMILILASSTIPYAFSGDPIAAVKQKVIELSGSQNLQTHAFHMRTIGPFQSVDIKFFESNNKSISATYSSWFGFSPQMKCYSESAKTPCHS